MAEVTIVDILKKLSSYSFNQLTLALTTKKELVKLKKSIPMIEAVIHDAVNRQGEKSVEIWLKALKDLAYDAEDILEEYDYFYGSPENSKFSKLSKYLSVRSNPLLFSVKISHKIKNLNQEFNELARQTDRLGLKIVNVGSSSHTIGVDCIDRETYAFIDGAKILGREVDQSNIVNMLLANKSPRNQTDKICVIPIVGMGGLGKTTLAQLVYKNNLVEKHFDLRIWVCVSDVFDVRNIFINIIESIDDSKFDDVSNLNLIVNTLQKSLEGKKFLLILDDVWNERYSEWNKFKDPLVVGAEGSKILITTRSKTVASIVLTGEFPSYNLHPLADDICFSIFEQRAFGPLCKAIKTPTLTKIAKELVKKCGGLPLAAEALGSLMCSKKDVREWEAIRDSQIWDNSPENPDKILPVLRLSYDHLPPQVKQCFSYCSLFPKDSVIERETLIRLWVAEGFIPSSECHEILMEEIGYGYFNSLLWNSFFQGVGSSKDGEITKFKMHDLIHDLAQSVVDDTHHCSIIEAGEMTDISKFRRLNLLNVNEESSAPILFSKSTLRTLFMQGGRIMDMAYYDSLFNNNRRLCVLDLSYSDMEELPSSIGDLNFLRYLDLSHCWQLKKLPDSFTQLRNLQTLLLIGCRKLTKFPKDLDKLVNLRHLWHGVSDWQDKVGQLTCLQNLNAAGSKIGTCVNGIGQLQCLNLLGGSLTITDVGSVRDAKKAQKANLKGKKYINELTLYWRDEGIEVREDACITESLVLEGLQPHTNLKILRICNFMGLKFPTWMSNQQNLVKLSIIGCNRCKQLPALGVLPSLRFLEVRSMFLLEEWLDQQPLQLSILLSSSSSSSSTPTSSYPSLESINISGCPTLRSMPTKFYCLREFNVSGASNAMELSSVVRNNLDTLTRLSISHVDGLKFLPLGLLKDNNVLQSLTIGFCGDFQGFIQEVEDDEDSLLSSSSSSLRELDLCNCQVLRLLPDLKDLTSLQLVTIQGCNKELVISLPKGIENNGVESM